MMAAAAVDSVEPLYTRYFGRYAVVMWCKDTVFLKDNFRKLYIEWKTEELLDSGYEMQVMTETLREVEAGKGCRAEVRVGEVAMEVREPIPMVVIKKKSTTMRMDGYGWQMWFEVWNELKELYGSHVERAKVMEEHMKQVYAESLASLIADLVRVKCHGCQTDHPSQTQHDLCLMAEPEERVEVCMSEALEEVDEEFVTRLWEVSISTMDPRPNWLERSKWLCIDYRKYWMESVISHITSRVIEKMK